ncbi:MAG: Sjogren's syndrome/scleroderma autoantigen 1 family protein [Fervidicoccaceae archaeon]
MEDEKGLIVRRSVELLRQGAAMLSMSCSACGAPLFKLKSGEVLCPLHGKVLVIERDEDLVRHSIDSVLLAMEEKIARRLSSLVEEMEVLADEETARRASAWLEVLERIRRLKSHSTQSSK